MTNDLRRMRHAGKTFFFASLWLDRVARRDAATLYGFCRTIDDIADDTQPGPERSGALAAVVHALNKRDSTHLIAGGVVALLDRFPGIYEPAVDLVESCMADGPGLAIETEHDLIEYAHGVAGNVGLMMYPILGGTDPRGLLFADDLGIAMQCTNIARDVLADARAGRVYLPREWLQGEDVSRLLVHDPGVERSVVQAVKQVLEVGRKRYERGLEGLQYLAPRTRFAIRVAADCYAAIGGRVLAHDELVRQRAVVPLTTKMALVVRALQGARSVSVQTVG